MYRGFSLKINEAEIDYLINSRRNFYTSSFNNSANAQIIQNALEKNIVMDSSISADKLKKDWFPEIKSDVFLSHSHKDIELAKKISRLLNSTDSHDKILAHVNIMLASALTKMLDNTECVIFLNTTNSIIPSTYYDSDKTDSPWIYHELFITSILPIKSPIRKMHESVVNEASQPQILHTPPLKHLTNLNDSDFNSWISGARSTTRYHSLDILYKLKPLKLRSNLYG